MPRPYIIIPYLLLASIILIYFLLPVRAQQPGIEPVKPSPAGEPRPNGGPPPKPIAQSEWAEKRSTYLTLYNSNSVEKRLKAVEFISAQLYERLIISDMKYASEVMEFLLQILAVEKDDSVINAAKAALAKLLGQSACMEWAVKNHKKLAVKEPSKLRFIEALSDTMKSYLKDSAIVIATDLVDKSQPSRVRLSAMELIARGSSSKSIEIMLELARDADTGVCKSALNILAGLKPIEKAGVLIKMLADEKRADIKQEIGRALEIIANQKLGVDSKAWQKWWDDNPLSRVTFQAEVDAAINKGVDYLLQRNSYDDELIFYTLIKSRVKIPDAAINAMLDKALNKKLEKTYNVALLAMVLSDLDQVKYLDRITQCAEFLLAGQSAAGNWHYGTPITRYVNTPSSGPISPTDSTSTRSVRRVAIKMPPRRADTDYDNSCTQYAILGLRACADALIEIPKQVWTDAERHLLLNQGADGGWAYFAPSGRITYGSMTAGGLGGLAICKFYLNKEIKDDKNIKRGMDWLAQNFTVRENPKHSGWHYYYLYALERAGIFAGTEQFGGNEWYPIGANYLINEQKPNGSWNGGVPTQDTCFAILFLRRATQPLKIKIEITPGGAPTSEPRPNSGEGK
ncbi:MAG: hypothetical protein AAB038_05025 [Planctomycetota bacterium]